MMLVFPIGIGGLIAYFLAEFVAYAYRRRGLRGMWSVLFFYFTLFFLLLSIFNDTANHFLLILSGICAVISFCLSNACGNSEEGRILAWRRHQQWLLREQQRQAERSQYYQTIGKRPPEKRPSGYKNTDDMWYLPRRWR